MLGLKDPDHYTGAENDTPGKRPSIDLLEKAAKLAGIEFQDCIQIPGQVLDKPSKADQRLHQQLQEILKHGGEAALWLSGNIETFHKAYVRKGYVARKRR